MRLWTYVLIPVAVALLVVLGLVAAVNSQPPAPTYAPPEDLQLAAPAAAVSTTAEQISTATTVQAPAGFDYADHPRRHYAAVYGC
jgi:hypothetical protein